MKSRKTLFVLLFMLPFLNVMTQENTTVKKWRNKYINFGYTNMTIKQDDAPDLKSDFGAAFTVGRTFYLHKKPIANMIRLGIDATWIDLNYANYKMLVMDKDDDENDYTYHQGDISMHIGPSITINPVSKLNIHGYFRFAPTFSGFYDNDSFYVNYAKVFVGGGSVSYGIIGLGIESRFGDCKYKRIVLPEEEENESPNRIKTTLSGWRAYLTVRF